MAGNDLFVLASRILKKIETSIHTRVALPVKLDEMEFFILQRLVIASQGFAAMHFGNLKLDHGENNISFTYEKSQGLSRKGETNQDSFQNRLFRNKLTLPPEWYKFFQQNDVALPRLDQVPQLLKAFFSAQFIGGEACQNIMHDAAQQAGLSQKIPVGVFDDEYDFVLPIHASDSMSWGNASSFYKGVGSKLMADVVALEESKYHSVNKSDAITLISYSRYVTGRKPWAQPDDPSPLAKKYATLDYFYEFVSPLRDEKAQDWQQGYGPGFIPCSYILAITRGKAEEACQLLGGLKAEELGQNLAVLLRLNQRQRELA